MVAPRGYDEAMTADAAAPPLPPALEGEVREFSDDDGARIAYYASAASRATDAGNGSAPVPLLLIHSINAAGSAYEVKPLFDHYRGQRPVYAIDMPGFGCSDRSDRPYSPRLMTDAVIAFASEVSARHGGVAVDALAVSLSCEYLARAAVERPGAFRSVGLVSPTGLDRVQPRLGAPGSDRGLGWLYAALGRAPWSASVYRGLTRPGVIRYFLVKTWGSKHIDEGLLAYDVLTTRQPGARYAPLRFVSAFLFSADIGRLYDALALPVWVAHGTRGNFINYRGLARYAGNPRWAIEVMPTGALPYFEDPAGFVARYERFLESVPAAAPAA